MIVTASRYGSTTQGAAWIAERLALEGIETSLHAANQAPPPDQADLIILGSGLYAHKLLPELNAYVDQHATALRQKKLAIFALAMRTTPVFVRGEAHGGLAHLDYLFKKLTPALIHADMLGGEMIFSRLSPTDATGLEKFYRMLKLPDDEITRRKAPRTLMNKADYWSFAETVIRAMSA